MSHSLKVLGLLASVSALGLVSPAAAEECVLDDGTTGGSSGTGTNSLACGINNTASSTESVAVGEGNTASSPDSIAIGHDNLASAVQAIAIGTESEASGSQAIAIGFRARAIGVTDSIAIGEQALSSGLQAIAIGVSSSATGDSSTAMGIGADAVGLESTALGSRTTSAGVNSVALGARSNDDGLADVVAIGNSATQRRIIHMAAGIADTDGVNVSQLRVLVNALGGGAAIDPTTGAVTGPTYVLSSGSFTDVGAALLDLDGRIGGGGGGTTYVAQAGAPGAANTAELTVGANTGGTSLNVANIDGDDRTITGVGAGALTATSNDAVNGAQLFATNANVATNTADIAALDGRVTTNEADIADHETRITALEGAGGGSTLVTQPGGASAAIEVGDATGGTSVDFAGTDGVRTLSGLADGDVSAGSDEAVTGNQLFATNTAVADNTSDIADNASDIAANTGDIAALDGRVGQNETDIAALDTRVTTTESNIAGNTTAITNLDGRVTQNEADIAAVQSGVSNANMGLEDVADALGGGSTYDPATGTLTAPTYNVAGGTQNDVGTALAALDDSISNLAAASANAVQYDTDASGARLNSVTLAGGDPTAPVTVSNVADGELSATSSDAVNGAQLFATNQAVAQNTSDIADNASDIAALDGRVGQNETDIANLDTRVSTNETNIAGNTAEIANLDGRVTVNRTDIDNLTTGITNGTIGLVQQAGGDPDGEIQVAANTGGTVVNVAGTSGPRRVNGVAAGNVSATSTDAINGSQFFALQNSLGTTIGRIDTLTARVDGLEFDLNDLRDDMHHGLAGVAAMGALPQSVNPGRVVLGVGSAVRSGEAAFAVGASFKSNDDQFTFNLRAGFDDATTVAVGAGVEF